MSTMVSPGHLRSLCLWAPRTRQPNNMSSSLHVAVRLCHCFPSSRMAWALQEVYYLGGAFPGWNTNLHDKQQKTKKEVHLTFGPCKSCVAMTAY